MRPIRYEHNSGVDDDVLDLIRQRGDGDTVRFDRASGWWLVDVNGEYPRAVRTHADGTYTCAQFSTVTGRSAWLDEWTNSTFGGDAA